MHHEVSQFVASSTSDDASFPLRYHGDAIFNTLRTECMDNNRCIDMQTAACQERVAYTDIITQNKTKNAIWLSAIIKWQRLRFN